MEKTIGNKVIVFDTTLRDGEQTPGVSFSKDVKVKIALSLEKLGVDVIEAGFPTASVGDFEGVQAVARVVKNCQVAALARANMQDIDRAWEAISDAVNPRIHTFISTSKIHLDNDSMSREQVVNDAVEAVRYASQKTANVQFSAQDATRTDREFLCEIFEAVIEAGATTINIPDTVGYTEPDEYKELISYVIKNTPGIKKNGVIVSVHCHDDQGLATANTLAGIKAGARQAEVAINGIGERAGNTALEEVVMALVNRFSVYKVSTNIETTKLVPNSKMITMCSGVVVQPNKSIVGFNAFAHESGIHQDKVAKNPLTYEIMTPESVGWDGNRLVMGKHSGRNGLAIQLQKMGYTLSKVELKKVSDKIKSLSDNGKQVTEDDIEAIVADSLNGIPEEVELISYSTMTASGIDPSAYVKFTFKGREIQNTASGNGPVDAVVKAILEKIEMPIYISRYHIDGINGGSDALAGVIIRLTCNGITAIGKSFNPNVIYGSAQALVNGLNHLMYQMENPKAIGTNPAE